MNSIFSDSSAIIRWELEHLRARILKAERRIKKFIEEKLQCAVEDAFTSSSVDAVVKLKEYIKSNVEGVLKCISQTDPLLSDDDSVETDLFPIADGKFTAGMLPLVTFESYLEFNERLKERQFHLRFVSINSSILLSLLLHCTLLYWICSLVFRLSLFTFTCSKFQVTYIKSLRQPSMEKTVNTMVASVLGPVPACLVTLRGSDSKLSFLESNVGRAVYGTF